MNRKQSIGVVGGGIAGLATAWNLKQLLPDTEIVVFEASERLGGVLHTEFIGDYLIETSADMFTTEPSTALDVCQQLGHADDLICTQPVTQRAFVATTDGICPVPSGFSLMLPNNVSAVVESSLLDEAGRSRFLQEEKIASKNDAEDESLHSFAVRRFGQQAFDRLIQPLVSGIYTADPQKLSMQATMNRFLEMEQAHGSLIAAAKASQSSPKETSTASAEKSASGARYDLFRAPRRGMRQLIDWMVGDLDPVRIETGTSVAGISKFESKWRVEFDRDNSFQLLDAVILATSANTSAKLMAPSKLSRELAQIEAASCAIVAVGFDKCQLQHPFEGFGIVVPSCLSRKMIAASFSSNKFAGRAAPTKMLARCFIGGALQSELVDLPDEQLTNIAITELGRLLSFNCSPELTRIYRWKKSMPQYHLGHRRRIQRINNLVQSQSGLELAGNSYEGVGIPVCLESGKTAARRTVEYLKESVT